jgi:type 1 glutamine amidotransferase
MPQLAKILAQRNGFDCTVLFAIDKKDGTINPGERDNIPGLEALDHADLTVLFLRFRELPDDQMKRIIDYTQSGRPIVGLRTSTHPFQYTRNKSSPYAIYSFDSEVFPGGYGRQVLGETWVSHYGEHQKQSTRGLIAPGMEKQPIVRGVHDIWGPSDVYGITTLSGDSRPIILGQVLQGMKPTDPPAPDRKLVPVAWIKTYTGKPETVGRIFATTMGHAGDFQNEGFRRLIVNACYWAIGLENAIPAASNVDLVGTYEPSPIGFGTHKRGIKPSDLVDTK